MDLPELYCQYNDLSQDEGKWALKNYLKLLKINGDGSDTFLDIGCGPGDITENILLPTLPKTFSKFVGADISEEMIKYAKSNSKDPRIVYKLLDITREEDLKSLGIFNHIFSFLALQMVRDQRQAVKNINQLLAPGGNMFVTLLTYTSFFDMYEHIYKKGLWHEYMYDYKDFSLYLKSEDPVNEFKAYLEEQGLTINFFKEFDKSYEFSNLDSFRGLMESVNPFIKRIPSSLQQSYIEDLLTAAKDLGYIGQKIVYNFGLIVAVATKSGKETRN